MSIARGWTQEYYDLLEFYFWEPQHLNRQAAKSATKTSAQVFERLRRLEVSFNHLMNIFFAIAPEDLTERLFQTFVSKDIPFNDFVLQGRTATSKPIAAKICQPDLLFEGIYDRVALEIKFGSRTSLEQIIKYTIHLKHYGDPSSRSKKLHLAFLSPNLNIWKGKTTFETYLSEIDKFQFPASVCKLMREIGIERDQVIHDAQSLLVSHFTYSDLFQVLLLERDQLEHSGGDKTLRNLINGLLSELSLRDETCRRKFINMLTDDGVMDEASAILRDIEGPQALVEIRQFGLRKKL